MRRRVLAATQAGLLAVMLAAGCSNEEDGDPDPPAGEELTAQVATDVAAMRAATARYVSDRDAAIDDGFFIITQHMPGMGHHYLNPDWSADGFDPNEPPILMFVDNGGDWQLVGFEWVFPEEPATPPIDGAQYGEFPAACHYDDGLFVEASAEEDCQGTHADSGAAFTFWHPDLVTLHVWAWLHNPEGLYHPTNPMVD